MPSTAQCSEGIDVTSNSASYLMWLMNDGVLIDYSLNGWAKESEDLVHEYYSKIHYILEESRLSEDSSDAELASFCKTEGCDMLTSDKRAY